jgi:hypothetical protein
MKKSNWILFLLAAAFSFGRAQAETATEFTQVKVSDGSAPVQVSEVQKARAVASYARLPLSFERNQGQTDPRVKFLARGNGYTLFLAPTEAILALRKPDQGSSAPRPGATIPTGGDEPIDPVRKTPEKIESSLLRMKLIGANAEPFVEGRDELPGKSNYFIGNDPDKWRSDVSRYRLVRYADVYPGIDLVYYGNQGQLEYDFVVAPGADPGAIQLSFEGADGLRIDDVGNLVLAVPGGELVQHVPLVYQKVAGVRRRVPGHYVLEGEGRVGFKVAAHDAGRPLVIDPVLSYSTYLGGDNLDWPMGIAVDSDGYIYVTGKTTWSSNTFPTKNAYDASYCCGESDAFVAKLDPDATGDASLVYSTYLGGGHMDESYGIAVDDVGNAYVSGQTASYDFPTENAYQGSRLGTYDAFFTILDPSGSELVYSTYLGGHGIDYGQGVAVNSDGYAYIVGNTVSGSFPVTPDAYQVTRGGEDCFVAKLDPNATDSDASRVYATYFGEGPGTVKCKDIAVDADGKVYVTGHLSRGNEIPTKNGYQWYYYGGPTVAFVFKLDPSIPGEPGLLYSTYLGGNGYDIANGIAVDSYGYAYVTGYTGGRWSYFPTENAYRESKWGEYDAFVTKLNPSAAGDASLLYSTLFGGHGDEIGESITVDNVGNAYISGTTSSTTGFPIKDAYQGSHGGGTYDNFVAKLDTNVAGQAGLVYSTYLGGNGEEGGSDYYSAIAVDDLGNVYVTGRTTSTDFETKHAYQPSHAGGDKSHSEWDLFVVKLEENQPPTADAGGPYSVAEGSTVVLDGAGSSDPDGDVLTYDWDLDGDGVFDDYTGPDPVFGPKDDNGSFTVSVQVTDPSGESDVDSAIVNVANVAPSVAAGADQTVNEGEPLLPSDASFSDPGILDTHTATVNWGNGTPAEVAVVSENSVSLGSHTYADNGAYTVTVTVTDDDGGIGSDTLTVIVNNVAPSVAADNASVSEQRGAERCGGQCLCHGRRR